MRKTVKIYNGVAMMPNNEKRRRGLDGTMPVYGGARGKNERHEPSLIGVVKRSWPRKVKRRPAQEKSYSGLIQKMLDKYFGGSK